METRIESGIVFQDLVKIREESPLIHNITNYVVMNSTANALLALGASPVMAHAEEEASEMAALASAVVLNIGTLSASWVHSMKLALATGLEKGKPVVLDPVGCGATSYRTQTARALIQNGPPSVIKGNASEIASISETSSSADLPAQTKGVDSTTSSKGVLEKARELQKETGSIIAVTGETDFIIGPRAIYSVENGHPLMGKVTGMGCLAACYVAAFCAVNPDYAQASAHALLITGIAGELAAEKSEGRPGFFLAHFMDQVFELSEQTIQKKIRGTVNGP